MKERLNFKKFLVYISVFSKNRKLQNFPVIKNEISTIAQKGHRYENFCTKNKSRT